LRQVTEEVLENQSEAFAMRKTKVVTLVLTALPVWSAAATADGDSPIIAFEGLATAFFKNNFVSCHGEKKQEDDFTLHEVKT
tara:strand:+ start:1228 stop:1473 length:246 start_codon:yes stop_codon:yes gene_type:complete